MLKVYYEYLQLSVFVFQCHFHTICSSKSIVRVLVSWSDGTIFGAAGQVCAIGCFQIAIIMTLQSLFHFRHNNFLFLCNKNENYFSSCIRPEVFAKVNLRQHPSLIHLRTFFIARNATSKLFNCLVLKTLFSKTKQQKSALVLLKQMRLQG